MKKEGGNSSSNQTTATGVLLYEKGSGEVRRYTLHQQMILADKSRPVGG